MFSEMIKFWAERWISWEYKTLEVFGEAAGRENCENKGKDENPVAISRIWVAAFQ